VSAVPSRNKRSFAPGSAQHRILFASGCRSLPPSAGWCGVPRREPRSATSTSDRERFHLTSGSKVKTKTLSPRTHRAWFDSSPQSQSALLNQSLRLVCEVISHAFLELNGLKIKTMTKAVIVFSKGKSKQIFTSGDSNKMPLPLDRAFAQCRPTKKPSSRKT